MKINEQQLEYCRQYIKKNYGEIPTAIVAEDLNISRYYVRRFAHEMGLSISPEQQHEFSRRTGGAENPNPITQTTFMLVCRYYYNGDSINKISYFLMRPKEVISKILDEAMKSGYYYKINNIKEAEYNKRKAN